MPNGGEVVHDNSYNDFPSAVQDLKTMHISYLNADYDGAVLEKWRNSSWNEKDAFFGCDGLTYIKTHLGYRYTVRRFTLEKNGFFQSKLTIHLTLENIGFGNTLKPFESTILFRNAETGEVIRLPLQFDFRNLKSGQKKTLTASLPLKNLEYGNYQIYFSIKDKSNGQMILLGNENEVTNDGYLLGQLEK